MKILVDRDFIVRKRLYHVSLLFEPRDMWIGNFNDTKKPLSRYICIIPCFPIHIKEVQQLSLPF